MRSRPIKFTLFVVELNPTFDGEKQKLLTYGVDDFVFRVDRGQLLSGELHSECCTNWLLEASSNGDSLQTQLRTCQTIERTERKLIWLHAENKQTYLNKAQSEAQPGEAHSRIFGQKFFWSKWLINTCYTCE